MPGRTSYASIFLYFSNCCCAAADMLHRNKSGRISALYLSISFLLACTVLPVIPAPAHMLMARAAPYQHQRDRVDQEPDSESLVAVDEHKDQNARHDHRQDQRDPAPLNEVERDEVALQPGAQQRDARNKERHNQK